MRESPCTESLRMEREGNPETSTQLIQDQPIWANIQNGLYLLIFY